MLIVLVILGVSCPPGLVFQECGNACYRSCQDLSFFSDSACETECVAGCNCPNNTVINEFGVCVEKSQCTCQLENGNSYPAGAIFYRENCEKWYVFFHYKDFIFFNKNF